MATRKDYCSCWWDGDWGENCREHDEAYERGGGHFDRWRADFALARGIARRATWRTLYGHIPMAALMFCGVRLFASRPVSFLTRGMWGRQSRFNWGRRRKAAEK